MLNRKNNFKGFTLIEVLVVIAIISIIAVMSILSWQSFSDSVALGNTAKMIETKIKLAKSYSLSALNDKKYGIRFEADKVTLFDADAAADIPPSYDLTEGVEIYEIGLSGAGGGGTCNNNSIKDNGEIGIDCGGGGCLACSSNLVFDRLTGITANSGTIGIRMINRPSKTKTIAINAQGQTGTDSFEASAVPPIVEDTANNINARHIHFNLSGWNIQGKPPITDLIFRKNDGNPGTLIEDIDTAAFFNAGIFDWQGSITVDTVAQKLRIHTLDAGGAVLCILRDRMENSKSLKISIMNNGYEEKIVTYTENADGTVTVTQGSDIVLPIEPQ